MRLDLLKEYTNLLPKNVLQFFFFGGEEGTIKHCVEFGGIAPVTLPPPKKKEEL